MVSSPIPESPLFLNVQQTVVPSKPASFSNSTTPIISSQVGITAAEALLVLTTYVSDALARKCETLPPLPPSYWI